MIEEFLSTYFWVFVVLTVLHLLHMQTSEYKEARKNAIIQGRTPKGGMAIILITIFIVSIKHKFFA